MGVYTKGMKMPNNCQECACLNDEHFYCQAVGRKPQDENVVSRRPDWCPLVEVPPHGRLIDADALGSFPYNMDFCDGGEADEWIENAPTIIEAEEGT